ncbi:sodium:solute symporter family protein [Aquabacterium sp. OR-4]|uniref:sodium:solute symporter family protein n=1 Tax=Aquabacterium sp. OR-4 TaxID=2978127 RepID=UPI0028C60339|nr:VC_2705 family sodium/solute symporter [Aquabacterium sp. OR-4]MDT7835435.1 VC_2705 family sodium/solute symporter [Aquabacterium sp. OR-4]
MPSTDSRASASFEHTQRFTRRLHRRYGLFTVGVVVFVGMLAALEKSGWSRNWIGASFLIATVLVYAAIGLLSRTTDELEYYVAGRRVPAMYNGMATAADWMSAASFIGTAGVLYLQGFNGLAYILGWTGGYCLVAVLLAPYLRRFGQFTIPDFIGARYGGRWPRLIALTATVLVSFVYVVVQVYGVGLITSHLTGFSFEIGIFVGLGGVLVCSFLGGMRAVTWTQVAQYIVLIIAYTVPVFWLSQQQTGSWLPLLDYRQQLSIVTERETALRVDPAELEVRELLTARAAEAQRKLTDVPAAMAADSLQRAAEIERLRAENAPLARIQQAERALERMPRAESDARAAYQRELEQSRAQARPLAGLAPQAEVPADDPKGSGWPRANFLALVLCLMLGTAAMPHVLTRYYTTPTVAEARRSVGWSLIFIVLLYVSAPALAVMVKYQVFTELLGTSFGSLPDWLRRWSKLDPNLLAVEDINGDGLLQLAELRLGADLVVLAAPELGGMPLVVTYLVAAGGLAAALSTADGLLLTISNALAHDFYFRMVNPKASAIKRVMMSKLMVLFTAVLAAWVASLRLADILPFVTAAFSLAAAAFFPALVLGIFWRRANRTGAVAGMLAGVAMTLWYMLRNLPGPREWWGQWMGLAGAANDGRWFGIDPMAAGVFGVPVGCAVLVLASLLGRRPDDEGQALVDELHRPLPAAARASRGFAPPSAL